MARPLPKQPRDDEETPPEPKLEVVPDPASLDEPVEAEEKDPYDVAAVTQDPLKLYVRQIGDGPLLTPVEERELAEMRELLRTAQVDIVATCVQHRATIHPRTYVGSGKLKELSVKFFEHDYATQAATFDLATLAQTVP